MLTKETKDNLNNAWKAVCELGDYFSRLGGSARPRNMKESDIFLYVACEIFKSHEELFDSRDYLEDAIVEAATPVKHNVERYTEKITLTPRELIPFLLDFYEYTDKKLKENDKSRRWQAFDEYLREINI